ncbi:uncharacterized protein LOC134509650 [Chroicocephalus ridibundus]|uniref:uncharacterized protein LOC134509650 n=1 Tax=Chroicocephalus ridibundus TaxID=1192867 RepID=UPI002FDEFE77
MPTTGHPTRASTPRSAGGRPGWDLSSSRGRLRGERTQRTQAPTLPASTAVFVPAPPPSLYPPPPQALPLLPGALRPQFPPQFPPGQPPSASYTDSPPGYPPAPANMSSAWVPTAVPTAHSDPIPVTQAPPLSREEFYREHQRLEEEAFPAATPGASKDVTTVVGRSQNWTSSLHVKSRVTTDRFDRACRFVTFHTVVFNRSFSDSLNMMTEPVATVTYYLFPLVLWNRPNLWQQHRVTAPLPRNCMNPSLGPCFIVVYGGVTLPSSGNVLSASRANSADCLFLPPRMRLAAILVQREREATVEAVGTVMEQKVVWGAHQHVAMEA